MANENLKNENVKKIPARSEVAARFKWDLSKLFANDGAWEAAFKDYEAQTKKIPAFKGTLGKSAQKLADFMDFSRDLGILEERLSYYAELRQCEDEGDAAGRSMNSRLLIARARSQAESAWSAPEIQAIPNAKIEEYLKHERLTDYRIYIKKLLRYKPYILSEAEERIIAIHSETDEAASEAFSVLTNVDMDFGTVKTPQVEAPLSQSTWSVFMENADRNIRREAYMSFYKVFNAHKTTLAALYGASVKKDAVRARVRGFASAREAALFSDNVKIEVYDNLISAVGANLAPLHKYYSLRKRALCLEELRHYDVYAPIVKDVRKKTTWEEACDMVSEALAPLGSEYTSILRTGLLGSWADRYENKGKRSGAFSAGSFSGEPYILMNYKEDSLRDVFTMAHEGGHSMHSYYSARSNPFMQYNYTIFEAEVASTFNEELLFRYLEKTVQDEALRLFILNKRTDDLLSTLYRQTMFAEFEKITHEIEEAGEALTCERLRAEYQTLLRKYFGPEMVFEDESSLEGLRIPHFYRAFYVYKYATGISASLALAERVMSGDNSDREDYFKFLRSGGSRFPLDSLKVAGVDMSRPEPVEAACKVFASLVDKLEAALK